VVRICELLEQQLRICLTVKLSRIVLLIFALAIACFSFSQNAKQLEIRFAPGDHVYLGQENRFLGLGDFQIQNIAVVNLTDDTIKIDEIVADVFSKNSIVKSNYYSGELLERNWKAHRNFFDMPGIMQEEDPRYRFKELLGDNVTLAKTTTLAPKTAILLTRQFFFIQAVVDFTDGKMGPPTWPDRVLVSVKGTDSHGAAVTAQNEMRIIPYQPKNQYFFPVRGRWYLGAASSVRSHHRILPVHEFALDLIQIGADGKSYQGEGHNLSDYYAYGKDVFAMGDGEVVQVYDGVPETRLRRADESEEDYRKAILDPFSEKGYIASGGNQIIIRHSDNEYSSYAHLKSGSILVKKGDHVKRGQTIAKVGLSGDGYQPHLHFQLNDGPDVSYARGIPMIFQNVKPVLFSSTIDPDGHRQLQDGEFIDTSN